MAIARTAFSLPYCWAHTEHVVEGDAHRYRMARRWPGGSSPHADMSWNHQRWPLRSVHSVRIDQNVIQAAGLPAPIGEPHALYSPGVDVAVAWFEKIR